MIAEIGAAPQIANHSLTSGSNVHNERKVGMSVYPNLLHGVKL